MSIFTTTKKLVSQERKYTALILKNLVEIEKKKLYCDLGYPSLYKYLIKELKYSEGESNIRINAVRLMVRSKKVEKKIQGKSSLIHVFFFLRFFAQAVLFRTKGWHALM